ncbi:hypothetical protein HanRHA438_Chr07g0325121 [Helianthus annuus]|nr:hypothetical protein HanRHA438_Chr07g0325121 [Helianthus annuus]
MTFNSSLLFHLQLRNSPRNHRFRGEELLCCLKGTEVAACFVKLFIFDPS